MLLTESTFKLKSRVEILEIPEAVLKVLVSFARISLIDENMLIKFRPNQIKIRPDQILFSFFAYTMEWNGIRGLVSLHLCSQVEIRLW